MVFKLIGHTLSGKAAVSVSLFSLGQILDLKTDPVWKGYIIKGSKKITKSVPV